MAMTITTTTTMTTTIAIERVTIIITVVIVVVKIILSKYNIAKPLKRICYRFYKVYKSALRKLILKFSCSVLNF